MLKMNQLKQGQSKVVKVGEKFRPLKTVKITKGTTRNWAYVVSFLLKRLDTASNKDIYVIWETIFAIVSDLCKINLNLASEIQTLIGSSWKPVQLERHACNSRSNQGSICNQ